MIITNLQKLKSKIDIIQEIPQSFFSNIEKNNDFSDKWFPEWSISIFKSTSLFNKFECVFNKYKKIRTKSLREKVIKGFYESEDIEKLCADTNLEPIVFKDLPKSIQESIKDLFNYLYQSAINNSKFEEYAEDSISHAIGRFIDENKLEVCPICGLETFHNLIGQSRIALDHWLCKEIFPMSAVNFKNLFPIGGKCNERPAKGSKNLLVDSETKQRIKAFYPYMNHQGINLSFKFERDICFDEISDDDWSLSLSIISKDDNDLLKSWDNIFNIQTRYKDYFRKNILSMWENEYEDYIDEFHDGLHANTVVELKERLRSWKSSFPKTKRPGAILYRCFIDYLINCDNKSSYLYGLCENFKRKTKKISN